MGHVIDMTVIQDASVIWRANATRMLALGYEETKALFNAYNAKQKDLGCEEPTTVVRGDESAIVATVKGETAEFLSAILPRLGYKTYKDSRLDGEDVMFTGRWSNGERWNFFLSMARTDSSPLHIEIETIEYRTGQQTARVLIERPIVRLLLKIDKITLEAESPIGRFIVELGALTV